MVLSIPRSVGAIMKEEMKLMAVVENNRLGGRVTVPVLGLTMIINGHTHDTDLLWITTYVGLGGLRS